MPREAQRLLDAITRQIKEVTEPSLMPGEAISLTPDGKFCRVRLTGSSRMVKAQMMVGAKVNPGNKVVCIRLPTTNMWTILGAYADNARVPDESLQFSAELAPPNNFTVTGIPGAILATWNCPPQHVLTYQIQVADVGDESNPTAYTTAGGLFYYLCEGGTEKTLRIRAVTEDWKKSAWTDWQTATAAEGGGGDHLHTLADLTDVSAASATDGQALIWDEGSGLWIPGDVVATLADHDHSGDAGDGGQFDLINLLSTGVASGYVPVADGSDGIAWEVPASSVEDFTDLGDVPASYSGHGGKMVVVNEAEDGLEFTLPSGGGGDIGAYAYHSSSQSIADDDETVLACNSEYWDTDTIHSTVTDTNRLTAKTAGKYLIGTHVSWSGGGTDGVRMVSIKKNALSTLTSMNAEPLATAGLSMLVETVFYLNVNDYVEVYVWQDSGGSVNVNVDFYIQLIAASVTSDADAIHDNVSGEINAVTEKTTPTGNDLILIEDSAASYVKKKLKISNLPAPTLSNHDHSGDAGDGGTFDAANLTSGSATDGYVLTADGAGGSAWEASSGGSGKSQALFYFEGTVEVGASPLRIYNQMDRTLTLHEVFVYGASASGLVVDIHKDGTTIFTNQAHRPTLSGDTGTSTDIDVSSWADGSYLTCEIDTAAGSYVSVHVVYS